MVEVVSYYCHYCCHWTSCFKIFFVLNRCDVLLLLLISIVDVVYAFYCLFLIDFHRPRGNNKEAQHNNRANWFDFIFFIRWLSAVKSRQRPEISQKS